MKWGSKAALITALSGAAAGMAVDIKHHFAERDNDALIDLTGTTITVPADVTLASGRGKNGKPGGLLYTGTQNAAGMIRAGAGARITGLRIRGHDVTLCAGCAYSPGIVLDTGQS